MRKFPAAVSLHEASSTGNVSLLLPVRSTAKKPSSRKLPSGMARTFTPTVPELPHRPVGIRRGFEPGIGSESGPDQVRNPTEGNTTGSAGWNALKSGTDCKPKQTRMNLSDRELAPSVRPWSAQVRRLARRYRYRHIWRLGPRSLLDPHMSPRDVTELSTSS
jgi:hypothetical protein